LVARKVPGAGKVPFEGWKNTKPASDKQETAANPIRNYLLVLI